MWLTEIFGRQKIKNYLSLFLKSH